MQVDTKKIFLFQFGLACIIGVVVLYNIKDLDQIIVLNDEFGYWSVAASFCGKDWKQLMALTPYYGFGYSLLLIPLMMVIGNSTFLYKAAILLNCLFVIATFFVTYWCSKTIFSKKNKYLLSVICFAITVYSNNIFQAKIAWTEVLLNLLLWIVVAILILLEKKPTLFKAVIFLLTCAYMYMVHQRSLGIIIAAGISLLVVLVRKKVPLIKIGSILLCAIIFLAIVGACKSFVVNDIWPEVQGNSFNDPTSSQMVAILASAFQQIKGLFIAVLGRIYYFGISTGFMLFLGIGHLIKKNIQFFKNIFQKEKIIKYESIYIFVLLAFLASLAIGSIYGISVSRLDVLVYGRYIENTIGPILLLGLCDFLDGKWKKCHQLLYCVVMIILTTVVCFVSTGVEDQTFNVLCSVGLSNFVYNFDNYTVEIIKASFIVMAITSIMCVFYRLKIYKKQYLIVLGIACLWIVQAHFSYKPLTNSRKYQYSNYNQTISRGLEEYKESKIYYILDYKYDTNATNAKRLQFMIPDRCINVIDIQQMEECVFEDNSLIFVEHNSEYRIGYDLICTTDFLDMYIK